MLACGALTAITAAGLALAAACSSADSTAFGVGPTDAARDRHVVPVDAPDAAPDDAGPPPPGAPSCATYCDAIMQGCKGNQAQYGTRNDCLVFCARLEAGHLGDRTTPTVSCRAYYASSPAATDPAKYCLAAGPFGGGICGDRCTTFCQVAIAVCSPDAGDAPFASFPDCRNACETFPFKDAGADGGGEGPQAAPTPGNTLNCREFALRRVAADGTGCADLGADSGVCH